MDMETKLGFHLLRFPRCDNFVKIQVGRRQPYWISNTATHATFTTSCHINSTGLKTYAWRTKIEDSIYSGFRDMTIFFDIQHGGGSHIGFLRELLHTTPMTPC